MPCDVCSFVWLCLCAPDSVTLCVLFSFARVSVLACGGGRAWCCAGVRSRGCCVLRASPQDDEAYGSVVRRITGALERWAVDGGWVSRGVVEGVDMWRGGLGDWAASRGDAVLRCTPEAARVRD